MTWSQPKISCSLRWHFCMLFVVCVCIPSPPYAQAFLNGYSCGGDEDSWHCEWYTPCSRRASLSWEHRVSFPFFFFLCLYVCVYIYLFFVRMTLTLMMNSAIKRCNRRRNHPSDRVVLWRLDTCNLYRRPEAIRSWRWEREGVGVGVGIGELTSICSCVHLSAWLDHD